MSFTTWPAEPVAGAPTPWGPAQYATTWIPGQAVLVGTASHGGFWISRHLCDSLDPELTAYAQETLFSPAGGAGICTDRERCQGPEK